MAFKWQDGHQTVTIQNPLNTPAHLKKDELLFVGARIVCIKYSCVNQYLVRQTI